MGESYRSKSRPNVSISNPDGFREIFDLKPLERFRLPLFGILMGDEGLRSVLVQTQGKSMLLGSALGELPRFS